MSPNTKEILDSITEHHQIPLRIGSHCESNIYYRIENLSVGDIELCARQLAEQVLDVASPAIPDILINLPGSYTGLAQELGKAMSELAFQPVEVISLTKNNYLDTKKKFKDKNVILVNDVITTARTCLAYHTQITMDAAHVLGWATLIDRTFGPGPVPVISAMKGEAVMLLQD